MFLRALKHLRKTVSFRLAMWYSAIFILSSLFLFCLAYLLLAASLDKLDQETIELKLKELATAYQTGGMDSLEREVTIDKKFGSKNPFFIRLAGPHNKTLLLLLPYQWVEYDIKQLEKTTPTEKMMWIRLPARNDKYVLKFASIPLTGDYLLQVGKSNEDRENTMMRFREIFAAVMIPLILCGFAGGTFVAFKALRPIRNLISTVRSIDTGKMDARVPSPQTGDELDELVTLFNKMLTKIESLIKAMRDSLDNVAHDLRTPMTRLRGMAEMALQSDQTLEMCQEALADSLEESERILTMLNTLMDISEAETGTIRLDLESVNMSALVEDVVELYGYVAEEKHVGVHTSCSEDLFVTADPNRIRQVLANLLDNALKYTPAGGTVDLEAHRRDQQIVMIIRDTGTGIPAETMPKIWDRLYRGDQSRSQKGLGLGLSLVKAIVQAHKGHVDVSSESGKGSTFTVYLPAADAPASVSSIPQNLSKL